MLMRCFIISCLLALGAGAASAGGPTVYQALDTFARTQGAKASEHIVMIEGTEGSPQPTQWIFHLAPGTTPTPVWGVGLNQAAPVEPVQPATRPGRPLKLTTLNLNSDGAFRIAERLARANKFSFDSIDYQLAFHRDAGMDVWRLALWNHKSQRMGTVSLSAVDGSVVHALEIRPFHWQPTHEGPEAVKSNDNFGARAMRSMGRWFSGTGSRFGRGMGRAAQTFDEILLDAPPPDPASPRHDQR